MNKSRLLPNWQWLSNPWMTAIGTLTGIISLGTLLYSWLASPAPRILTITSDPPVTIVRGGQASSVDILYHGEKIKTDVYVRQVYVWNAGSESIRPENVLEQFQLVIPESTILETRVRAIRASAHESTSGKRRRKGKYFLEHPRAQRWIYDRHHLRSSIPEQTDRHWYSRTPSGI